MRFGPRPNLLADDDDDDDEGRSMSWAITGTMYGAKIG
jgi:hypothetical protein